jgi:spore maturation protein CgeB
MRFVMFPLSITSSWGNGHATNYRALGAALARRGHEVAFLERNVPWYEQHRDVEHVAYGDIHLYRSLDDLDRFADLVARADVVVVGSFVPQGVAVIRWVDRTAGGAKVFYDIDTPVTLEKLGQGDHEYLSPDVIPVFDLYLSFTGGPALDVLETRFGARRARVFYCIVDADAYAPRAVEERWDLGYLGTHSEDREAALERLLLEPARRAAHLRFCIAGPNHPDAAWPANVERIDHLAPAMHPDFYCAQRFTLNITRAQMVDAGYSPSVRLFEAAASGIPIISDKWPGIDEVFEPESEVLLAEGADDVLGYLQMSQAHARRIGRAARDRVLRSHSAKKRVEQLETYLKEI